MLGEHSLARLKTMLTARNSPSISENVWSTRLIIRNKAYQIHFQGVEESNEWPCEYILFRRYVRSNRLELSAVSCALMVEPRRNHEHTPSSPLLRRSPNSLTELCSEGSVNSTTYFITLPSAVESAFFSIQRRI